MHVWHAVLEVDDSHELILRHDRNRQKRFELSLGNSLKA